MWSLETEAVVVGGQYAFEVCFSFLKTLFDSRTTSESNFSLLFHKRY